MEPASWFHTGLAASSKLGNVASSSGPGRVALLTDRNLIFNFRPQVALETVVGLTDVIPICSARPLEAQAWSDDGRFVAVASGKLVETFVVENGQARQVGDTVQHAFDVKQLACQADTNYSSNRSQSTAYIVAIAGVRGVRLLRYCKSAASTASQKGEIWTEEMVVVGLVQSYSISSLRFSSSTERYDGSLLLVASSDGHLGIWKTGTLTAKNKNNHPPPCDWKDVVEAKGRLTDACFSLDALYLALSDSFAGVVVYHNESSDLSLDFQIFFRVIHPPTHLRVNETRLLHGACVSFSPSGKFLACSGGGHNQLNVIDVQQNLSRGPVNQVQGITGLASLGKGGFVVFAANGDLLHLEWPPEENMDEVRPFDERLSSPLSETNNSLKATQDTVNIGNPLNIPNLVHEDLIHLRIRLRISSAVGNFVGLLGNDLVHVGIPPSNEIGSFEGSLATNLHWVSVFCPELDTAEFVAWQVKQSSLHVEHFLLLVRRIGPSALSLALCPIGLSQEQDRQGSKTVVHLKGSLLPFCSIKIGTEHGFFPVSIRCSCGNCFDTIWIEDLVGRCDLLLLKLKGSR